MKIFIFLQWHSDTNKHTQQPLVNECIDNQIQSVNLIEIL